MSPSPAPSENGGVVVEAPLTGTVVAVLAATGQLLAGGRTVVVIESMKMEHEVTVPVSGRVSSLHATVGDAVSAGDRLVVIEPSDIAGGGEEGQVDAGGEPLEDLEELSRRRALTADAARPHAVAKRHAMGLRTARENLDDLCDTGSFVEYGALVVAAQKDRRSAEELLSATPADGLVGGLGRVNGGLFGADAAECVVLAYDYTVLAGTQGYHGHRKKDRLFELAARLRRPVVLFAEGGGGRPGDTSAPIISGLDTMAFALFGRLSGLVPLVGVVAGRCFAGNAALLGCCDVVIAVEGASIGMAGPAMIEAGGLGRFRAEEVGPATVQASNGVIDVMVADEAEAVAMARRYLSYFQGSLTDWSCADQDSLRSAVPADRRRAYDVHRVVDLLADTGSVLELRAGWAPGVVTALGRLEGRPVGIVANNPIHLGGAIDSDGADKAARFLQLCDGFDLPVVFLCDTPGFMVGPEAERTAQVRHFSRLFVIGGSMTVPFVTVVLRKGYGLGAQAMAGGSFKAPALTVAWPTGEIGGMNLEGAVRLGFRKELEAERDEHSRRELEERLVAAAHREGRAMHAATQFELDDVIDPADTRRVALSAFGARPATTWRGRPGKKRPCIDTW